MKTERFCAKTRLKKAKMQCEAHDQAVLVQNTAKISDVFQNKLHVYTRWSTGKPGCLQSAVLFQACTRWTQSIGTYQINLRRMKPFQEGWI